MRVQLTRRSLTVIHVEGDGHAVLDLLLVEIDFVVEGDDAKDMLVGRMLRHVSVGDTDAMSVMQTGDFNLRNLQVVENDVPCEREKIDCGIRLAGRTTYLYSVGWLEM